MSRRRYLVAYDIRDPQRLRAIHAAMKGFGEPLQYSVFLCDLDGVEKLMMRAELKDAMNEREDSIAIVDLGEPNTRGMECFEFLGLSGSSSRSGDRV